MKNLITLLIFAALASNSQAQTASNFTHTDIDGNSHTLYDELANGNIVVLKFFTNWCSVCHNSASSVISLYNSYQSNGDPVVFWALARQNSEGQAGAISFDAAHNFPFPVFGEAESIANSFGVQYQPEYRIIRPDYSYTQTVSSGQIDQQVQAALSTLTGVQDPQNEAQLFSYHEPGNQVLAWSNAAQGSRLSVFDISGKKVVSTQVETDGQLDNLQLGSGIYTAVLRSESGVKQLKFAVIK